MQRQQARSGASAAIPAELQQDFEFFCSETTKATQNRCVTSPLCAFGVP
jgi:hypothetical protein